MATKSRAERKAELEQLSETDQDRFELIELWNKYHQHKSGETLPSGTLLVTEILDHEYASQAATACQ